MTVVARRGHVQAALGRFSVNAALVDRDRPLDEDAVLLREIQILMTPSASSGQVERMCLRELHAGGQDVVISMAAAASRHIGACSDVHPSMNLVILVGLLVACAAAFVTRMELRIAPVRNGILVYVAIQAEEIFVNGRRDVFRDVCLMRARLMAAGAIRISDAVSPSFLGGSIESR